MGYLQLNKRYPIGYKGSRIQGFEWSAIEQADKNTKELQKVESLAKVIWTLFIDIKNNNKICKGRKKTMNCIRMLYIPYSSVCDLETWDIISRGFRFNWIRWIGYTEQIHSQNRKDVKSADKVFKKQTPGPDRSPLLYCH